MSGARETGGRLGGHLSPGFPPRSLCQSLRVHSEGPRLAEGLGFVPATAWEGTKAKGRPGRLVRGRPLRGLAGTQGSEGI